MKILWVEDFGGGLAPSKIAAEMLRDLLPQVNLGRVLRAGKLNIASQLAELFKQHSLHEIVVCKSYFEWKRTYVEHGGDFDIALIDINLEASRTPIDEMPEGIDSQQFDKRAGFHIYHQLIKQGFLDDNIAFFTGEAQSLDEFSNFCGEIFLDRPKHCFEKDPLYFEDLRRWLREKSQQESIILRRGIIEGCRFIQEKIRSIDASSLESSLVVYKTIPGIPGDGPEALRRDSLDYLARLERFFLSYRMGRDFDLSNIFIKELAAKWEESRGYFIRAKKTPHFETWLEEQFHKTVQFQMKMLRNWSAHRLLSAHLSEKEIAYFFMLAMRSWVETDLNEIFRYEEILSTLFNVIPDLELNRLMNSAVGFDLEKSYEQLRTLHKDVLRHFTELSEGRRTIEIVNRRLDNYFLGIFRELGEMVNWLEQFEQVEPGLLSFQRRRIRELSPKLFYQSFWHGLFPLQIKTTFYANLQAVKFNLEPLQLSFLSFLGRVIFEECFREEEASENVA